MGLLSQTVARGETANPVANQSVAAGGTYNSDAIGSGAAKRVRAWYATKGANSTAKLQGSFDGTTWYDLQTLAAGVNAIVEVAEPHLRVTVTNAGAAAETNNVWIHAQL